MCARSHSTSPRWRIFPTKQFSVGDEAVFLKQHEAGRNAAKAWFRVLPSELAMAYGGCELGELNSFELSEVSGGVMATEAIRLGDRCKNPPPPAPVPMPYPCNAARSPWD